MRHPIGEPVASAERLYRGDGGTFSTRARCWRYYYDEQMWEMRLK